MLAVLVFYENRSIFIQEQEHIYHPLQITISQEELGLEYDNQPRWLAALPWVLLLLGLIGSLWLWFYSVQRNTESQIKEINRQTQLAAIAIERRVAKYTDLLLGLRGFFDASEHVSRSEFAQYISSLNLSKNYPGVRAVQFSRLVTKQERAEYEKRVRHDVTFSPAGFPSFSIHPPGERAVYLPVEYNEPMVGNETALGHDQIFEQRRREVMERARDSGLPRASAPIQLIQDTLDRAGFVIRVPLYKAGLPILTEGDRRSAYYGQLTGVFVVEEVLQRSMAEYLRGTGRAELRDQGWQFAKQTSLPSATDLLHAWTSPQANTVHWWQSQIQSSKELEIAGRIWVLSYTRLITLPWLEQVSLLKLLAGSFLSGFIFFLARYLIAQRNQSHRRALEFSGKLLASEERTSAVLASTIDGIATLGASGEIHLFNPALANIFETSAEYLLGRPLVDLLAPAYQAEYRAFFTSHESVPVTTVQIGVQREIDGQRANGTCFPLEITLTRLEHGPTGSMVAVLRDVSERHAAAARLRELALHDALTGLPNRNVLSDRFHIATERAQRSGTRIGLMFIDLDRFKNINDSLGHQTGDQLLRVMSERLGRAVRGSDTVARMGGDEFVILLPDLNGKLEIEAIIKKLQTSIYAPCPVGESDLHVTPSIGVAFYPDDGADLSTLLKNADVAMYRAKEQGRNNCQYYRPEMSVGALEKLALENDLRGALLRGEFELHYQPQVDLRSREIIGVEALIRWLHPRLGCVMPGDFIPLAEETGMISSIGEWVLQKGCEQVVQWNMRAPRPLRLAVNLSPRQFRQRGLVDMIQRALASTGLAPELLELELTESVLLNDTEETIQILSLLKTLGVRLAIDDFGVGYSSLAYLKRFPIDRLKIDRSFIRDISSDPDDAAIARAIIAMAHSLKLNVVAEGVETSDHLDFLDSHRCDIGQGYFFARPLKALDFDPSNPNVLVPGKWVL